MAIDSEHYARSLASLGDARAVMDKARRYLAAWPDPYRLAHEAAGVYLREHTGQALDPDNVWWHVFDSGVSAPTFTGWRHAGPPRCSMRFTELLIHRFAGGFQAAPDVLPVFGGFYTRAAGAGEYGVDDQVALLPQAVMDDLWRLDFASVMRARVERFWGEEGEDFALLAKARFIAAIDEGVRAGLLERRDRRHLLAWLGFEAGQPLTLARLARSGHGPGTSVRHYTPGAGHLFTLSHESGRVVLYAPTLAMPLRAFANHAAMLTWIAQRLAGSDGQAWVDALYRVDQRAPVAERRGRLQMLRQRVGSFTTPTWPFGEGRELMLPDLFDTLQLWAKADLNTVLHNLVGNAELRKQLWRGYLGAFIQVFGIFAAAAWPIGLAMLGAGTARMVLDIDMAVRARSSGARDRAILEAFGDALVVVFSIIDAGLGLKALVHPYPPHWLRLTPQAWEPVEDAWQVAERLGLLDNNRVPTEPPSRGGPLEGVMLDDDGATWIEMQAMSLPVRYHASLSCWMVVQDLDALEPSLLVRRGRDGRWRLYAPGGDMDGLVRQFWDTYMQADRRSSDSLSRALLARQAAHLEEAGLPVFEGHMAQADRFGHHFVERDGVRFYTFRQEGEFHNDLVMEYSGHMAKVNDLFRGERSRLQGIAQDELRDFVERLADSLEQLPKSKASLLWREGRSPRVSLGARYRAGEIKAGDLLVSTDITSFTSNPFIPRRFMLPPDVADSPLAQASAWFDDDTVLYELVGSEETSGAPVAPMSLHWQEAEVLFLPGRCFRIDGVGEVRGEHYRFVTFRLREVDRPFGEPVHELRTGQVFDRQAYAGRVADEGLVERFFPAARWR
ncbi:dermonecrotic toxin domain-containing protein [Pseudomonas sp. HLMP]|uniref:dermonecrotic toxin domain-containing protein n=1 Tax=Pseudomonas sp. HLMP TaxID=3153767 RepID=UPI0039671B47